MYMENQYPGCMSIYKKIDDTNEERFLIEGKSKEELKILDQAWLYEKRKNWIQYKPNLTVGGWEASDGKWWPTLKKEKLPDFIRNFFWKDDGK